MFLDQLNLNQLRVFECVYRVRSTTRAAQELHLTQSGVSQHIRALETALDVPLFDRIRLRLVPTRAAVALYDQCSPSLQSIEQALGNLKEGTRGELRGTIAVGMPVEFGNNLVLPLLTKFGKQHPGIRYKVNLGFASKMNERLLSGELDFAFVDEFRMDRKITVSRICDETLELCVSHKYLQEAGLLPPKMTKNTIVTNDPEFFEALDYVEYEPGESILRMWFAHHLRRPQLRIKVRATVMDAQGISRLISDGLGAGILPDNLLNKLDREKHSLIRLRGTETPVRNTISVAYLSDRSHSAAVLALLEFLETELTS